MDSHHEPTVNVDELKRWARIAGRFQPDAKVEVLMDPTPHVKAGVHEIRTMKQWHQYWNDEILQNHWDPRIAALSATEKPQSIKDLIRRLENKKKKKTDNEE